MTDRTPSEPAHLWPDLANDVVILAAIPFLGYTCAWMFEWGYATHYHIPIELIRVELPSVALASAVVAATGLAIVPMSWVIVAATRHVIGKGPKPRSALRLCVGAALPAGVLLLIGALVKWPLRDTLVTGLVVFVFIVARVLFFGDLEPNAGHRTESDAQRYIEHLRARIRRLTLHIAVMSFFMLVYMGYVSGGAYATTKKEWAVTTLHAEEFVLLRSYGDLSVFARIQAGRLAPTFQVRRTDAEPLELHVRLLGQLTVPSVEQPADRPGSTPPSAP